MRGFGYIKFGRMHERKRFIRYKVITLSPRFVVSIEIRLESAGGKRNVTINKISFILIIRLFRIQPFVGWIEHSIAFTTRLFGKEANIGDRGPAVMYIDSL